MRVFILLATLTLSACASMLPNQISAKVSSFDGAVQTTQDPSWVYHSKSFHALADFQLGLYHTSKAPGTIFVNAIIPGVIENIEARNGLQFNIDGEIVALSSSETFTKFDHDHGYQYAGGFSSYSSKMFVTNTGFIKRLLDAEDVKVRLLTQGGALVGDFKTTKPASAQTGFRKTLESIGVLAPVDGQNAASASRPKVAH